MRTFKPRARALTMRSFGAISAVPFGKVRSRRRVPLSGRVMPLQLLSATCSTSMVVLRSTCCLVGWWAPHSERGNFSHPRRLVRRDLLVASRRRGTRRIAFLALSCRPVCIACGHRRRRFKQVQTTFGLNEKRARCARGVVSIGPRRPANAQSVQRLAPFALESSTHVPAPFRQPHRISRSRIHVDGWRSREPAVSFDSIRDANGH